jgi:hypothetical protein
MISEQKFHAQASSAFPQQPRILPLEFNKGFLFRKCTPEFSWNRHRLTTLDRVYTVSSGQHRLTAFRDESAYLAEVIPVLHSEARVRMEKLSPPPRFSSALKFACTRVDTCHPGNCMRTTTCIPFARSLPCQELRINRNAHVSF